MTVTTKPPSSGGGSSEGGEEWGPPPEPGAYMGERRRHGGRSWIWTPNGWEDRVGVATIRVIGGLINRFVLLKGRRRGH